MTKKEMAFYDGYNKATACSLSEVYGRYSAKKARAERFCKAKCAGMNGAGFRIISANSFHFTCGWLTIENGGANLYLNIETAANSYKFAVN